MPEVWLGLGSNLGDRVATLDGGLRALAARGVAILAVSSLYATAPQGVADQPEFYNVVARAATALPPRAVLAAALAVEAAYGRQRTRRWGPRTLDIDLLFYDDLACADANLTLPHPRLWERAFVLAPLLELWPGLRTSAGEPGRRVLERLLPAQPARAVAGPTWRATNRHD